MKKTITKILPTLDLVLKEFIDLEKQYVKLNDDINKEIANVDKELEIAHRWMIAGIVVASVSLAVLITVCTFGVGALVGCPVICGVLAGIGLTTTNALIGTASATAVVGAVTFAMATSSEC